MSFPLQSLDYNSFILLPGARNALPGMRMMKEQQSLSDEETSPTEQHSRRRLPLSLTARPFTPKTLSPQHGMRERNRASHTETEMPMQPEIPPIAMEYYANPARHERLKLRERARAMKALARGYRQHHDPSRRFRDFRVASEPARRHSYGLQHNPRISRRQN
uniref:Uncharacterized protein n=1 Tax=Lotharella globosa TaxID=91324 RepID=A0A7S3Z518_9EUKA|mmetsp:Transcript_1501/g.2878  ORF Transcript_1501/g.2878 Transcript_1501/m.2878 type:complete len:162 (+) Transcript_1501:150-635(+)